MVKLYRVEISGIVYVSAQNEKEAIAEARENINREKYEMIFEPKSIEKGEDIPEEEKRRLVRGYSSREYRLKDFITCVEFKEKK